VPCPGGPYTCFICVEEKGSDQRFLPHRCSVVPESLCCKPCYIAWVESQIDAEAAVIKCCHCDVPLEPGIVARLVDEEHMAKYCAAALQRTLRRDANFIWCSKCSGGGWVDPRRAPSECGWTCPECSNSFVYCPFCRREHGTISCKRFQQLRQELITGKKATDYRASEDLVQRNSKMCPSCNMPIQKDGGCNFMDCPNCRRHFCWSCGRVLKGSHQAHHCDAGFEGSAVISKTPLGQPCVELTRLFTNVLDLDHVELMNVDEVDLVDLREMLVPGLREEVRSPLFVGPSECDGELVVRLPFGFRKSMNWELTHLLVRASHPPAPHSHPPRSVALIPNIPSVQFSDFDDPTVTVVQVQPNKNGVLVVPLEQFRSKGTFRRVTTLSLRFSVRGGSDEEIEDPEAQVFFNDLALFGVPGESGANAAKGRHAAMMDERANLIVSPVLKRRWGEEAGDDEEREAMAEARRQRMAEAPPAASAPKAAEPAPAWAAGWHAGRAGVPMPSTAPPARPEERGGLRCATPGCGYLVHSDRSFGGFCCISCSEGGPHGPRCERNYAPLDAQVAAADWRPEERRW